MPQLSCRRCSRALDYQGDRPSFCAYCGQPLAGPDPAETVEHRTPPPGSPGEETTDYRESPDRPAAGPMPEQVGGYRLIRKIGRGGMGTVYEAEDSRHGRRVAIKLIARGYVSSPAAVERFRREGRLASNLSHPRCVFVLEADEDADGRPFIAMELMTGETLQDLVERAGPMPVGEAVARLLDVVEGLAEAHRVGLIHRDVKPSNCFLDGDGRVKVGDFGLSKATVGSASLTKTGAFLGTPLYASPEQIRVEVLDARTDVYSASATMFFLLTGRAPFDRGDAAATMARIVTEPAPSARERRPEVPAGLDRAIRRGLERDRDRRFADLDEFRSSLLPYLPGRVRDANPGSRLAASLFDYGLVMGFLAIYPGRVGSMATAVLGFLVLLAYFTVGDGVLGGSPGKRLFRLRVVDVAGTERATIRGAATRSLVLLLFAGLPLLLSPAMPPAWNPPGLPAGQVVAEAAGLAILGAVVRRKSGFRGLHDLAGGTRVIESPREGRRRAGGSRRPIGKDRGSVTRPVGVTQAIGPYKVRGAVRWEPDRRVLAGEDSTLGREAWIVLRPRGDGPPPQARRELARPARPRWLAGGEQAEGRWDAYVAPSGCPLADLAGPDGLPWRDARPILEDLADELAAACGESTLPPGLSADQVWVQPDGRAILVDPLARLGAGPAGLGDEERALSLLRRSAALALEGGRSRGDDDPEVIRATVPLHASKILGRLLGGADPCRTVEHFRADLAATAHLPAEVLVEQRARQLLTLALFVSGGLISSFFLTFHFRAGDSPAARDALIEFWRGRRIVSAATIAGFFPAVWIAWDFATRGGYSHRLAGLALVRPDGRPAQRWRCAWRSLLAWSIPAACLFAANIRPPEAGAAWASWAAFVAAAVALAAEAILVLVRPSPGPHDLLSGLRVVPR